MCCRLSQQQHLVMVSGIKHNLNSVQLHVCLVSCMIKYALYLLLLLYRAYSLQADQPRADSSTATH